MVQVVPYQQSFFRTYARMYTAMYVQACMRSSLAMRNVSSLLPDQHFQHTVQYNIFSLGMVLYITVNVISYHCHTDADDDKIVDCETLVSFFPAYQTAVVLSIRTIDCCVF